MRAADFALRVVDDRLREFNPGSREVRPNTLRLGCAPFMPNTHNFGQSHFESRGLFFSPSTIGQRLKARESRKGNSYHSRPPPFIRKTLDQSVTENE